MAATAIASAQPKAAKEKKDAYAALLERCKKLEAVSTSVAYPCEVVALTGAIEAAEAGLIKPILVGPAEKIREIARQAGLKIDAYPIEDVADAKAAAAKAVEIVRAGRAEVLM